MTLFERIAAREVPAEIVYEDDEVFAFRDINPQAPVHVLIVPKRVIARINDAAAPDAPLLGRLLLTGQKLAAELGISETGYRLVLNNGRDAGESIPHLHLHLLGGRPLHWPPG
ncbi:MAG: histidine triad nucleotide-binding protein [Verrucomicrobia bacterium]|jgi:histidine triad (HIT) family protein|nr:histidine triad nucleotide-binding protein [Verrucomicrobiota bacterium]